MPVNTAALKTFAPAMRRQLLEAVGRKLDLLLNSQTPDTLSTYAKQIAELREQEAENREQLLERVAYTWFNRLCALRYLDARGWHPFGCKVLMPAAEGETQPELLKVMRAGNLPAGLQSHTDESKLHGLLDGHIQTAINGADPQSEVYRQLVLAVCRWYHELLPNLFEGLDDASELLLPDDLLSEGSIVGSFRKEIDDDDCQDVESLGWLYQFYIAEKKDEVMARKKAVPTEDIPAVTQLFTPHWIVRYLVENSLGRLWLLNRPASKIREQMPYYIEGEAETDFLVINKPEEIKLLDPACGSGHMLTYAFDLLVLIYEEEGYSPNEIPDLILKYNLHGLEICPRAAQLAELALVFKAREQSRRFFQPEQLVRPQIIELQDVRFKEGELNVYIEALDLGELFDPNLFKLLHQSEEAKNFGSLIQPCLDERAIADVRRAIEAKDLGGQIFLHETHLKVLRVLDQAEALTQRYHVVVANPPYMGRRTAMNVALKLFIGQHYDHCRADVYAAFLQRSFDFCMSNGLPALVTMQSWLFLSSYLEIRGRILAEYQISRIAHLGARAFDEISGEVVQTVATVFKKAFNESNIPVCFRLVSGDSSAKEQMLLEGRGRFESMRQRHFLALPDCPIVYWLPKAIVDAFSEGARLETVSDQRQGLATGDDGSFIRMWSEVSSEDFNLRPQMMPCDKPKWFQFIKGGGFRKWYGNNEHCIRFDQVSFDTLSKQGNCLPSKRFYLRQSLTWSDIAGSVFGARFNPEGKIFATGALSAFPKDTGNYQYILAYLNSIVNQEVMSALSSGIHYSVGYVDKSPIKLVSEIHAKVSQLASEAIELARSDWDNFETSWDFRDQPLLRPGLKGHALEASCRNREAQSTAAIRRMQELETENNRLFIAAYGLEGELQPEVPENQITLARFEVRKEIAALLSYATGCMMGRYSLDQPGLILANAGDTLENYFAKVGKCSDTLTFQPDSDGIIPVLDGEWFEDDIVARSREFLRVTFSASSLNTDLAFIETALGKDLRKYFCSDFYKDHLQTYKKRPIYWLVQSPKKGFSCLIYLHRYTKDTLNLVLNHYFRPYMQKLEARLAQLGLDQLNDELPTRDRTVARKEAEKITKALKDCQAWEQDTLLPLAQQRIELDLDDGVKANYLKLQDVLAPIPGLAAKEDQ